MTTNSLQLPPDDGEAVAGLRIYRASRLEALIEPLWSLLGKTWSANMLEPQVVVAAHAGMKQWLSGALARHVGTSGIVANLEVILPSTWLDRLAQSRLGGHAVSLPRYQRQHLRWTLHEMLSPAHRLEGVADPRIAAYLSPGGNGADPESGHGGDLARKRFQLADQLARNYSQYLVYRPDWLRAWEGGQFRYATAGMPSGIAQLESQLLGPLWRQLAGKLGRHRATLAEELRSAMLDDAAPRPTLHVFGVSHLAPAEIALLRAHARTGLVALYVPDPCREYWGGLHDDSAAWATYRKQEAERISEAGEGDYWHEQGHPLLARWGRMGQHFFAALNDGEVRADIRHWQDDYAVVPRNRLERLQESLRKLDPGMMAEDPKAPEAFEDASLRIHACHTRLRELEVLRDALLDAVATQGIRAGGMVVMAPDIQAYVPLIPSVFGEPGSSHESRLPYHLADIAISRSHGLFNTFQRLLALPGMRITAPEVADFLEVPEIRQRFGLDDDAVENLVEWLQQSRVAWGLDGTHRENFGVPAIAEHTFAWAMDRMLAGYLMSDAPGADRDQAIHFDDGTELVPVTGMHGPSAEALGSLDRLLLELQAWSDLAKGQRKASDWAAMLDIRLDALFKVDPWDAEARESWNELRRFVRQLEIEPAGAGEDPELHFSVVRDLLVERLAGVPERQRFLMGGITFCGMVPQRAIPFDMVAVLGLNEGEFPRNASDGGLDLMARVRRMGDRDVRNDDRYLFLETLMSARMRLHLSYIGVGVKDGKPRNPAAPLAELMAELDHVSGLGTGSETTDRPWWVKHPLQPFDARYFDGSDARLYSFRRRYADMHGSGSQAVQPFMQASAEPPDPMPSPLAISEVAGYYRDPAKNLLQRRLKLRLDALDEDRLREEEPLSAGIDRIETIARKLFFSDALPAWPDAGWHPDPIPAWLRLGGVLPPGRLGEAAWANELQAINDLLAAVRKTHRLDQDTARQGQQVGIDVEIIDRHSGQEIRHRLAGRVANVFPLACAGRLGWQLIRAFPNPGKDTGEKLKLETELDFGDRVPMFLDWALLRLQSARDSAEWLPVRLTALVSGKDLPWQTCINAWDEALLDAGQELRCAMLETLEARVARLVNGWWQAQQRPHWYFRKTSWKAVTAMAKVLSYEDGSPASEGDGASINQAWLGGEHSRGERDHGSGYNRLLAGDVDFENDDEARNALLEFALQLDGCISFPTMKPEGEA